jgi:hypothetical protein
VDTSSVENVALFSAVLAMTADGYRNDPELSVRSGISEKKGVLVNIQTWHKQSTNLFILVELRANKHTLFAVYWGIQTTFALVNCCMNFFLE